MLPVQAIGPVHQKGNGQFVPHQGPWQIATERRHDVRGLIGLLPQRVNARFRGINPALANEDLNPSIAVTKAKQGPIPCTV